jgi:hypothetical protein
MHMITDEIGHGDGELIRERFGLEALEENVFFFAVMAAVSIGADEVGRGVDGARVGASLGSYRVELPIEHGDHALDHAVLVHERPCW